MTLLDLAALDADRTGDTIARHYLAAALTTLCDATAESHWLVEFLDLIPGPDWFRDPQHRTLYAAALELAPTMGELRVISEATLVAACERLEGASGGRRLSWPQEVLDELSVLPVEADLAAWREEILPCWHLHRNRAAITELLARSEQEIHLPRTPARLAVAQQCLAKASELLTSTPPTGTDDPLAEYLAAQLGPIRTGNYDSTGYAELDRFLGGGFGTPGSGSAGKLVVLAARPAMGKSAFGLNLATNALLNGRHVWLASLEMGRRQVANRIVTALDFRACLESRGEPITGAALREQRFTAEQRQRLSELQQLHLSEMSSRLTLLAGGAAPTPQQLCNQVRLAKRRHPGLSLVVIDYLGLLELTGENRTIAIGEATKALKLLAEALDITVVLLCQLSRAVEQRSNKMPQLSDLRESGNIEQDADVVLALLRPAYYDEASDPMTLLCGVLKNREGACGTASLTISLPHGAIVDPTSIRRSAGFD